LDLIAAIDKAMTIKAINPAVRIHTGHAESALIETPLAQIVYQHDRGKLEKALIDARSTANAAQVELQIATASGTFKDFLWIAEWSESNDVFFCTARDISAEKQLQRVKNEFIAMVSHDLRSPLMSVDLTLQAMQKFAIDGIPEPYKAQLNA